tara:strand:+ start:480 stop:986 length:507 start_codon:yes stop_codon:yes gene_type:complete
MRIFFFFILSLLVFGCSTVEVTKEVIKVTNTVTDKVKESVTQKKEGTESVVEEIIEEKEIEEEIEIIEEKQELDRNIIENQQKLADIKFIGKAESVIYKLLGTAQLSRIDGSVYTLRYDSNNCRLFLFFNQDINIKRVEYFELRNDKAELLNSKESLKDCYREFNLLN